MNKTKSFPPLVFCGELTSSNTMDVKTVFVKREVNTTPQKGFVASEEDFLEVTWNEFCELPPEEIWIAIKARIDYELKKDFGADASISSEDLVLLLALATMTLIVCHKGISHNERNYVAKKVLDLDINLPESMLDDIINFATNAKTQVTAATRLAAMSTSAPSISIDEGYLDPSLCKIINPIKPPLPTGTTTTHDGRDPISAQLEEEADKVVTEFFFHESD